jgi:hypothetical protein
MKRSPQVRVTLSDDLLHHLRKTALEQRVPLRWLVAGLICDTLESRVEHHSARQSVLNAWRERVCWQRCPS